jgi:hypothetical protein
MGPTSQLSALEEIFFFHGFQEAEKNSTSEHVSDISSLSTPPTSEATQKLGGNKTSKNSNGATAQCRCPATSKNMEEIVLLSSLDRDRCNT